MGVKKDNIVFSSKSTSSTAIRSNGTVSLFFFHEYLGLASMSKSCQSCFYGVVLKRLKRRAKRRQNGKKWKKWKKMEKQNKLRHLNFSINTPTDTYRILSLLKRSRALVGHYKFEPRLYHHTFSFASLQTAYRQ